MTPTEPSPYFVRSIWAKAVFIALALMWGAMGWVILLDGGYAKGFKGSKRIIYVDGLAGQAMAFIFLCLAAIAVAVVLQSLGVRTWGQALSAALILGPPLLYLMA